jgi:hypothetical protein
MEGREELEPVCGKVGKTCSIGVALRSLSLKRHFISPSSMMQQLRWISWYMVFRDT